jgi:diguanylate cyclase (GGDEF)-like protein/PAS domain S-box-containing protein
VYALGWGHILVVAFVAVQVVHAPWVGSAAWRPTSVFVVLWIVCAQVAVALGWVFVYVDTLRAMGAASLGLLGFAVANRHLGKSIEERERAEAAVRSSEERFRALVQDSNDVICVLDAVGRITYASPSITRIAGDDTTQLIGTDLHELVHPDDRVQFDEVYQRALGDGADELLCEVRLRDAGGGWRWHELTFRNLMANAAVAGVVGTLRDVAERREAREQLEYDANHDALTGLANRGAFLRALEHLVRHGGPDGGTPAVLFIDLDLFKEINDTLGHEAGDGFLVAVADMLRRSVLGSDVVGRLGGDEFAVALTGVDAAESAVAVANRLIREMRQPVVIAGQPLIARASIGIAVAESADVTSDQLLRQADSAMYAAKRDRTGGWRRYEPSPSPEGTA